MPTSFRSRTLLLAIALLLLTHTASALELNFTDSAGRAVTSMAQCGEANATTNINCTGTGNNCTWSISEVPDLYTTARFKDPSSSQCATPPAAISWPFPFPPPFPLPPAAAATVNTQRQSVIMRGCAGGSTDKSGQTVKVSVSNSTGESVGKTLTITAGLPSKWEVGGGSAMVTEGGMVNYSLKLYTKSGYDCNDIAYMSVIDIYRVLDYMNNLVNAPWPNPPMVLVYPIYPDPPPEVQANQTVIFRNWTGIYEGIANGSITNDTQVNDAKYLYVLALSADQCQSSQPPACDKCSCQKRFGKDDKKGEGTMHLGALNGAVTITTDFALGYMDSGGKFTKYSGLPVFSRGPVAVLFDRNATGFAISFNNSMPDESSERNFRTKISAIDDSGNPTNRSAMAGEGIVITVESEYVKNFKVNMSTPSPCAFKNSGTSYYTYNCTYAGTFIPKEFEMSINKPGLYTITVTAHEGKRLVQVDPFPWPTLVDYYTNSSKKIVVRGMPKNVSVEAPADWFEWVPFDVVLSVRDGNNNTVGGKAYNISITVADAGGTGYTAKQVPQPNIFSCLTDPLTGKCGIALRAEAPLGAGNGRLNITGIYYGNSTLKKGGTCPASGADFCPGNASASVRIFEAQCANFTVSPPDPPTQGEPAGVINATNISFLVNEANSINHAIGPLLIGFNKSTQLMNGNASLCYDSTPQRAEICVNESAGMFVTPPGAGIFCIKEFTYTPEVDGMISDHLNFLDSNLSLRRLRDTFYYPRLVWGWGFLGPAGVKDTCGNRTNGTGYTVSFGSQPLFSGEGDYFNLTATSVRGISLPPFNITWNRSCSCDAAHPQCCGSPYQIKGMEGLLVVDSTKGGSLRLFDSSGKFQEEYPFKADDYRPLGPNSVIADKRGNVFVADTKQKRILVFKLARSEAPPTILKQQIIPEFLELEPPPATGANDYEPTSVAVDTFNRLFVAGLTNPGQVNNWLVIQVFDPTLTTIIANYSEEFRYGTTADISVDPQGVFIYLANGGKSVRQFTHAPDPMPCPAGGSGRICETKASVPKSKGGSTLFGFHLFIPCRHLGGGCWDKNCRETAPYIDWWHGTGRMYYTNDLCSVSYMESMWGDWDGMYTTADGKGCKNFKDMESSPENCHQLDTARFPEHDDPNTDHRAMGVFYKKGYVFVVDRLSYDRKEEWGGCAASLCPGDPSDACNILCINCHPWGCDDCAATLCQGCSPNSNPFNNCWPNFWDTNCYDWNHRNRCGNAVTRHRVEYWVRVFREDQTKGNALTPVFQAAFSNKVYNNATGNEDPGNNFPYDDSGSKDRDVKLWSGHNRSVRYLDIDFSGGFPWTVRGVIQKDESDVYGWQFTAGKGNAGLIGIKSGETSGLFVDDDFNVYLTVTDYDAGSGEKIDFVYKVPMYLTPTGGSVGSPTELIRASSSDISKQIESPHDVIAYPDIIKQTLSQGIFCEGCSDKGLMEMDVCKAGEEQVSGTGVSVGSGVYIKSAPAVLAPVSLNTSIDGRVDVQFPVTINTIDCGTKASSGTVVGSCPGSSGCIKGRADALSNSINATVEGGLFKVAFSRPYRPMRDIKGPHTLPILDYAAMSVRLLTKHFFLLDNLPVNPSLMPKAIIDVCGDSQRLATELCQNTTLRGGLNGLIIPSSCVSDEAACGVIVTESKNKTSCKCKDTDRRACGNNDTEALAVCTSKGNGPDPTDPDCREDYVTCGTYATKTQPRVRCQCGIAEGMINSSYRLNYTLLLNNFFNYSYVTSDVDIFENVSPNDASSRRYDAGAQRYLPPAGSVSPWPSGYENTTLGWQFVPAFVFLPERYVKNPLPMKMANPDKILICSELVGTSHSVEVKGGFCMCGEPGMIPPNQDCINNCPAAAAAARTCRVTRSCTGTEAEDECGLASVARFSKMCNYTIPASIDPNNPTNSPVRVQLFGYDSSGAYVSETFDNDEVSGKGCGPGWLGGDKGLDWDNVTKVAITAPTKGNTVVGICYENECANGSIWFSAPDGIPRGSADHRSARFGFVPNATSVTVTYPPEELLAPADKMNMSVGYALMLQPLNVTNITTLTIDGYTRFGGELLPVNGYGSAGGSSVPLPIYAGDIWMRFYVFNDGPETLYATVTYRGRNLTGPHEATWVNDSIPSGGSVALWDGPGGDPWHYFPGGLDSILITTNGSGAVFRFDDFLGHVCLPGSPYFKDDPSRGCVYVLPPFGTILANGTKFIPDMQNITLQLSATNYTVPRSGPFYMISSVTGNGGWFGDRYYVMEDTKVILKVAYFIIGPERGAQQAADPLYNLAGSPDRISVSAHMNLCCNTTEGMAYESPDTCSQCTPGTSADCSSSTEAVLMCGTRGCFGGEKDGSSCSTDSDCPDGTCIIRNYYTASTVTGTVLVIGLDERGKLISETTSLGGKGKDELVPLSKNYSAIYRVNLSGGYGETLGVWAGTGASAYRILRLEARSDPFSGFNRISGFEPENRRIRVRTLSNSDAQLTITGSDSAGTPATMLMPMGGTFQKDSAEAVVEVYTINVTGASPNETFNITTVPFDEGHPRDPKTFGTVYVRTGGFIPFVFQDLLGVYLFSSRDPANARILDDKSLGYHSADFLFYDRFNNTFIWNQPFNFTLPTRMVLQIFADRDKKDGNLTHVNLTATLYYATLQEPDKTPSNPLSSPNGPMKNERIFIEFYEFNTSISYALGERYVSPRDDFLRENNDVRPGHSDTICSCPCLEPDGTEGPNCTITCAANRGVSGNIQPDQQICTTDAECTDPTRKCMGGSACTTNDECGAKDKCTYPGFICSVSGGPCATDADCKAGPGGSCNTDVGRCKGTGRCLHNFGGIRSSCESNAECPGSACDTATHRCAGIAMETDALGMASVRYDVCGWGRHRAVALFQGTHSFAPAVDIQPYYSGGLPLDIGSIGIWATAAIIALALAYKLYTDSRKKHTARA